jgi:alanine racemase
VDLAALRDNYRRYCAATSARVSAVVKADAYGLGLRPVADALYEAGCRTFFVAFTAEGVALRKRLRDVDIYVLAPLVGMESQVLLSYGLTPCLYDLEGVDAWLLATREAGMTTPVVLHVESGINRLGMHEEEVRALCNDPRRRRALHVSLLMSHLACADDPASVHNARQLQRFQSLRRLFPGVPCSLSNSAGVFLGRDYHFDVVRAGIGLYGHDPHYRVATRRVRPVVRFEASLAQIKRLRAGEFVGYGATFVSPEDREIGVVLAGYADGVNRRTYDPQAGPPMHVSLGGVRVRVLGRISMDMTTINLSALHGRRVVVGDPVEFFGTAIPVEEVAEQLSTIPYEIFTRIGSRVVRVYDG